MFHLPLMYNLCLHPQKHTTVRYRSFSFTALLYQIPTHRFNPNSSESSVSLTLLITPRSSCYQIITRQLQMFIMFPFNCNKQHESGCWRTQGLSHCCFFPLFFHVWDLRHFLCVVVFGWCSDGWRLTVSLHSLLFQSSFSIWVNIAAYCSTVLTTQVQKKHLFWEPVNSYLPLTQIKGGGPLTNLFPLGTSGFLTHDTCSFTKAAFM